jgi:hypothetical protein
MIKYRMGATMVAGMAITLIAATPLRNAIKLQPESKIWVSGKSSVKDFKCQAKTIDADLGSPAQQTDLALPKLVSSATIGIATAELDCGNGTMNEHMRKALKVKEFATIAFKLSNYEVTATGDITVNGALTIAGQTQTIELKGKVSDQSGTVRSTATADIDMTKWGVKPPSLMMGTMKVKPVVTIGYDIAIKR